MVQKITDDITVTFKLVQMSPVTKGLLFPYLFVYFSGVFVDASRLHCHSPN